MVDSMTNDIIEEPKRGSKVKRVCKQCGKVFYVYPYLIKLNYAKYCCDECRLDSFDKKIECICKYCGDVFYLTKGQIKSGRGKYCCSECKSNDLINKVVRKCEYCGRSFYTIPAEIKKGGGKYCCVSCYHNSKIRKEIRVCARCGKTFEIEPYRLKKGWGIYCSAECQHKSMVGEKASGWKGGVSFEPYCILFNNNFKERVRAFFGNKCIICGKTKEENGRLLCVHHVNYDKETCCNDSDRLFVSLCNSCHVKTNSNRDYWQEYFTKMINEEYDGKCYYTKEEYNGIKIA